MDKKIGHYAFVIGVVIAIVLGIAAQYLQGYEIWLSSLLVVLGLVVGWLNVTGKEMKEFMMVSTVLVIMAFVGEASNVLQGVLHIGVYLQGIFNAMLTFIIPATIVVGLRDIWGIGQSA